MELEFASIWNEDFNRNDLDEEYINDFKSIEILFLEQLIAKSVTRALSYRIDALNKIL